MRMTSRNPAHQPDRARARRRAAATGFAIALGLVGCASGGFWGDLGFFDPLEAHDPFRWERSHGWSNGTGFACSWRADHVVFDDGTMALVLDDTPGADHDLSCGEYRTLEHYRYGRYEASFQAAKGSGVVTAFFIYTGPAFGDPWDELSIEVLGRDTTEAQFTLFADGEPRSATVDLGFDAAEGFHTYAIEWTTDAVRWFVDGRLEHVDTAADGELPSTPGRIYANIWASDGLMEWAGEFRYPGEPLKAAYDWIRHTPSPEDDASPSG